MKAYTKQQLLEIIQAAPDNAVLLIPSHDHSYRAASVQVTKAEYHPREKMFNEYHGDQHLSSGSKVIDVIVIS